MDCDTLTIVCPYQNTEEFANGTEGALKSLRNICPSHSPLTLQPSLISQLLPLVCPEEYSSLACLSLKKEMYFLLDTLVSY